MRIRCLAVWTLFAFVFLVGALSSVASEMPTTMKVIKVRRIEPKPEPGSFDGEPVSYWVCGTGHGRMEAEPEGDLQMLMIMSDPNIWMINLVSKTGRHIVDHRPPLIVHFSIFGPALPSEKGKPQLDLGHEVDFFRANSANMSDTELNGKKARKYEVVLEGKRAFLLTDLSDVPLQVGLADDKETTLLEYVTYREVSTDPAFFRVPEGIEVAPEESLQEQQEQQQ